MLESNFDRIIKFLSVGDYCKFVIDYDIEVGLCLNTCLTLKMYKTFCGFTKQPNKLINKVNLWIHG